MANSRSLYGDQMVVIVQRIGDPQRCQDWRPTVWHLISVMLWCSLSICNDVLALTAVKLAPLGVFDGLVLILNISIKVTLTFR